MRLIASFILLILVVRFRFVWRRAQSLGMAQKADEATRKLWDTALSRHSA